MVISVICVYNDEQAYHKMLAKTLINQDTEYELIEIDNTKGRFSSSAQALNYGASLATGDILIFSHQDIVFKNQTALRQMAEQINQAQDGSIIGVVGVRDKSKEYFSNLTDGLEFIAEYADKNPSELIEVSAIDECLFGMNKSTWEGHPFDENLCDGWHLYAVEQCLFARKNAGHIYVCPIPVHHFSYGNISRAYMKTLVRMVDYYHKDFRYIWTTCYKVRCSQLGIRVLYGIWIMNRKLRRKKGM